MNVVQRPTIVLAHNKTLAAQLYHEFRGFFPENAVEYFVSYYDYYQPEAYIASTDTYIEKNPRSTTRSTAFVFPRRARCLNGAMCVIVASVSCIYGLGSPEAYYGMLLMLERGQQITRREILTKLVEVLYERNDLDFKRGTFRVRGDTIEVHPTYENSAFVSSFGATKSRTQHIRSAYGRRIQGSRPAHRLSQEPLCHAASATGTGGRDDQGRACRLGNLARTARPAARSA